jgi:hypothetical protein
MPSASPLVSQALHTTQRNVRLQQDTSISTQRFGGQHTFVLLAKRLILPNQVVAHRLHFLYFIMVLGKGSIKLGLQQGGVLPGLVQFLLQGLCVEHRITISLGHIRFLSGSLHDILHKATY